MNDPTHLPQTVDVNSVAKRLNCSPKTVLGCFDHLFGVAGVGLNGINAKYNRHKKSAKSASSYYFIVFLNGGWGRNRTGVHGVAVRCITTLPPSRGMTF